MPTQVGRNRGRRVIVATIAPKRPEAAIRPGLNGFLAFCELIEFPLEPYMRRIARAYFGTAREICVVLPRGNAKTTMAALIALHHLLAAKKGLALTRSQEVCCSSARVDRRRRCWSLCSLCSNAFHRLHR
jgi:hypothetical protein